MKIYCCETHVNHALDVFIAKEETFPILETIKKDEKLSTKCEYCDTPATYIVANG
ncbi:CxxH/CxxC protein [Sporosarcina sp. ACRSL]|uniref:CxxH/CxxC protein n=1 Tax=Sporosarcina sp. ACRSL TaxID=2918215 RepID=UPI001EF4E510|nr:CxxH/CxxC protein [Sporosarcina sp. ACRSL]MCG7345814.1 CxxH/CxxC protein [Sporosarcina sp. ACRSL]